MQNALNLLNSSDIDVSAYFQIDEFDDKTEVSEEEFLKLLQNNQKCCFEFYLEVLYLEPIDYDSTNKKVDSSGFYEDCYDFPFSEETLDLLSQFGYGEKYFKDWVKPYYGKPEYEEIWDGETLYDEDYFDKEDIKNYLSIWRVYDYFQVDFND